MRNPRIIDYANRSSWLYAFPLATISPVICMLLSNTKSQAVLIGSLIVFVIMTLAAFARTMVQLDRNSNVVWLDELRKIDDQQLTWLKENGIACTIHKNYRREYVDFDPHKPDQEEGLVLFTIAFGPLPEDKWLGLKALNREWRGIY